MDKQFGFRKIACNYNVDKVARLRYQKGVNLRKVDTVPHTILSSWESEEL